MTALRIGDEPLDAGRRRGGRRGAGPVAVAVEPRGARERMAAGHAAAEAGRRGATVYGRTTGVGANRHVEVRRRPARAHRRGCCAATPAASATRCPTRSCAARSLVRLAQMAAGGGGNRPEVADALAALLRERRCPSLRDLGGIGTGDLTRARPARRSRCADASAAARDRARRRAAADDLQRRDVRRRRRWPGPTCASCSTPALGVAALTFHALRGNGEAFAAPLAAARPLSGLAAVSARMRVLIAGGAPGRAAAGPVRAALPAAGGRRAARGARRRCTACSPSRSTPPPRTRCSPAATCCTTAASTPRRARSRSTRCGSRWSRSPACRRRGSSHLMAPRLTGLPPFLAVDEPGSSGVLIAEYLAADALGAAARRGDAGGARRASSISRGLEEHASFAWQAAWQTRRAVGHLRTVLALEWIVAERALRMAAIDVPPAAAAARATLLAAARPAAWRTAPIGRRRRARGGGALAALADGLPPSPRRGCSCRLRCRGDGPRRAHLMTHFGPVSAAGRPVYVRGEGCHLFDDDGQPLPRRAVGAVLRQRRPRPRGARGRGRRADARARLRDDLGRRAPARARARRADRRRSRPATSSACSSRRAGRRRSSRR